MGSEMCIRDSGCIGEGNQGRAGIWWNSAVENVMEDVGRNEEELLSIETGAGYKTERK